MVGELEGSHGDRPAVIDGHGHCGGYTTLGGSTAEYLQNNANDLNIEYLIWRQRIWINGQSGWTWMADRGGITANHYDHVHVTVNY